MTFISPLHFAAYTGYIDVIKYFIENVKMNPHIKDNRGYTPLHYAIDIVEIKNIKYFNNDIYIPITCSLMQ